MSTRVAQLLEKNHVPPQRYGTAFHLTPPVQDVRQLPVTDFTATPLASELAENFSATNIEQLLEAHPANPYLLWHVAHADHLPVTGLTVAAGMQHQVLLAPSTASKTSEVLTITIEAGATLEVYDMASNQEVALRHVHIIQQENSTLRWWAVRNSLTFAHERMRVELVGSQAQAQIVHLVSGSGAAQYDGEVVVNHIAPDTVADVRLRTTVADTAAVVYRGRLTVARAARGTRGYQQGRALMLSPTAVADLLPQLDIGTNEVKCSHGVSTLHLDDAALFYLRSRGLADVEARRLAILGFWHDQLAIPQPLQEAVRTLGIRPVTTTSPHQPKADVLGGDRV